MASAANFELLFALLPYKLLCESSFLMTTYLLALIGPRCTPMTATLAIELVSSMGGGCRPSSACWKSCCLLAAKLFGLLPPSCSFIYCFCIRRFAMCVDVALVVLVRIEPSE